MMKKREDDWKIVSVSCYRYQMQLLREFGHMTDSEVKTHKNTGSLPLGYTVIRNIKNDIIIESLYASY